MKDIKPRGCFPDNEQGWKEYNEQFKNLTDEEKEWLEWQIQNSMDNQHYNREKDMGAR